MTKQQIIAAKMKFYKDNNIDTRTLSMIVRHYLSIGEQAASNLTDDKIEKIYERAVEEQKEIESKKGSICLITPEFQRYILKACQQLYKLPDQAKYDIIKKNI